MMHLLRDISHIVHKKLKTINLKISLNRRKGESEKMINNEDHF